MEFALDGRLGSAHSWVRVRTDGNETTLTFKQMRKNGGFEPMIEHEVKTADFAETVKIMGRLAKRECIYFENSREAYELDGAYITLDKWPKIPLYVEIEAPSNAQLKRIYKKLGIKGEFVGNVAIHGVYKRYGLDFLDVMRGNSTKLERLLKDD
ncbi:CYTH domain-containing protein [Candidatus Marsarchaeota archaeon]|nr:CYTH domain-containing protein [Candidatus Marsarchaeota archaeon]MCL5099588.1 CYTH domain-containing protein [Candidatus Marsarchaeota archaeon]